MIGMIGGFIATQLGGWDNGLATLLIFMEIDYASGLIVAGVLSVKYYRKCRPYGHSDAKGIMQSSRCAGRKRKTERVERADPDISRWQPG